MRSLGHNVCVLVRWAILTVSLSTLLFLAAGTTQVLALWTYMAAMSTLLLVTMLAVDPKLAEERVHPGMGTIDPGIRIAASCLFLLTLTTAAVDVGRLHTSHNMPAGLRFVALILFTLSGSLQAWAMALNPFFSPGSASRRNVAPTSSIADPTVTCDIPVLGDVDSHPNYGRSHRLVARPGSRYGICGTRLFPSELYAQHIARQVPGCLECPGHQSGEL